VFRAHLRAQAYKRAVGFSVGGTVARPLPFSGWTSLSWRLPVVRFVVDTVPIREVGSQS